MDNIPVSQILEHHYSKIQIEADKLKDKIDHLFKDSPDVNDIYDLSSEIDAFYTQHAGSFPEVIQHLPGPMVECLSKTIDLALVPRNHFESRREKYQHEQKLRSNPLDQPPFSETE